MIKRLIVASGIANLLFGLFHILLGVQIHVLPQLAPGYRALMEMENVGGTLLIFFFAWASLFNGNELINTRLGRSVMISCLLLYWTRAAGEFVFAPKVHPLILVVCLLMGGVYVPLILASRRGSALNSMSLA
jgi:hypothetical protein